MSSAEVNLSAPAQHAAATTAPIADSAHSTLSNALTTPAAASVHEPSRAATNVVISDPAAFAAKRRAMVQAGRSRVQIIADFDRTVSAFRTTSGAMCAASHQLLESCVGFNGNNFYPRMDAINSKYFALEISHDITEEQRAAFMLEWWNQAHDLLLEQGIRHQSIEEAVSKARKEGILELRAGARQFLHRCSETEVPVLIFSAGLKETIRVTLAQEQMLLKGLHLIGNEMEFELSESEKQKPSEESRYGLLLRFGEDVITSSNKNYSHVHLQVPEYHAATLQRRNLILMGDNVGDANMAKGLEGVENIIKIGFLHENIDARIEQFKSVFDVVLLNDADFSFAQQLLEEILLGEEAGQN